ncbi:DHA2 family efflux MFS transporter permease subunit [Corynebacterium felinum]|uniref:DHA2 family lincomycin resistance protein-like MFS transporter n=1 Tax=Corynebacterium felinum TaxID=131318 RepID=A0ABU2B5B6_9CORY|nr:DHA2 family efflux MFS transporter permease subunit [Corynebacterium felinum]MDF5821458.1 DHA2 family efflux MFS transporter permease subunit [Corynebacterium felinum]MDR7353810.1 DHA2 family lincomycin resistance protein-like MFS transporter [Corynebacterium felinum]WJY95988.1 putative transport protein HsrA [Corynebacterium felinum]
MEEHAQHSPPPAQFGRKEKQLLAVLVLTTTVMILNETVLAVALPAIMVDFAITESVAQWLTTGFMLTMASVIPMTGWVIERFSTRRVFFAAISLFFLGTVIAASAPIFAFLLAGRIIQATGTALVFPLLMTTVARVVPINQRGHIMGIVTVVIAVAPALGPTTSGVILRYASWHWVFLFMVPFVLLSAVAGFVLVRDFGPGRASSLDFYSIPLAAGGFGGLVYGLSTIGTVLSTVILGVALACIVAFVHRQRRLVDAGNPLLDLRTFENPTFRNALIIMALLLGMFLGSVTIIPIYLQKGLLVGTVVSGLVVMPGSLIQGLTGPKIGAIFDKVGLKPLLIPGVLLVTIATIGMYLTTANTDSLARYSFLEQPLAVSLVALCFILNALGLGLSMTPLMTTSLSVLPKNLYSHGSATIATLQQLAGAIGTAVLILALSRSAHTPTGASYSYLVAILIAVIVIFFALRMLPHIPTQPAPKHPQ